MRISLLAGLLLFVAAPTWSDDTASAGRWYDDKERGWFWRESRPDPAKPSTPKPKLAASSSSTSAPLSTAWLREQLPKFLDAAQDAPTPANIERYMLMERLAIDRAETFAQRSMALRRNVPYLDESVTNPVSSTAKRAMRSVAEDARRQVFAKLKNEVGVGVYYFFRSDCSYCKRQDPILQFLGEQSGLSILPISLDGRGIPGGFVQFTTDRGQAAQLGVTMTPTLMLARPPNKIVNLSTGLRTFDELEDRIVEAARDAQWITDAEYDAATRGSPRRLLTDSLSGVAGSELTTDPDALLALLRQAAVNGMGGTPVSTAPGVSP